MIPRVKPEGMLFENRDTLSRIMLLDPAPAIAISPKIRFRRPSSWLHLALAAYHGGPRRSKGRFHPS